MLTDTDRAWRKWGESDPYYAVLSASKFRRATAAEHEAEFFESGVRHAVEVLETLDRHFGRLQRGRVLDFGCGVGRVAIPFARHFEQVTGLDVSEAMLNETRRNLARFGATNVSLALSDDRLSQAGDGFDLVHSYIVLQHIPVRRGLAIISELLRRTAPGGGVALHVSLRRNHGPLQRIFYQARHRLPLAQLAANLATRRRWNEPRVQMNEYDLPRLLELFVAHGIGRTLVVPEQHGQYCTALLFGRRTPGGED
jgi:ubiquinone/menaquinone biosynthesis C-methylase UbiE